MADISSYPRKAPKLGDLILFSETYDVNAAYPVTGNPTKTTTVGALVSLVEASGSGTVTSVTPQANRVSGTPITTSGVINFANGTNTTVGILGDTITINASSSGISSVSGGTGITVNYASVTDPIVSLDYGTTNYIVSTPTTATSAASTSFIGLGDGTQASKITLGTIPVDALTQVKSYVDNTISGGAIFQSGYNANSGLPVLTTGTGISAGFMYTVTVAGSAFYTVALDVGDVLISNTDSPADVDDWTIVVDDVNVYGLSATSDVDKAVLTLTSTSGNSPVYIKGSGGTSVGVVSSEIVITGLEIGATGTKALAGDTTTITSDQAAEIVLNNAKTGITTTQATAITNSVKNDTNPSGTNKVTNIVTLTSFPPAGGADANTLYIII
jgi:hypothetical protein